MKSFLESDILFNLFNLEKLIKINKTPVFISLSISADILYFINYVLHFYYFLL